MTITASTTNAAKAAIQNQAGWRSLIKPYLISAVGIGTSVTTGDLICQYLERNQPDKPHNKNPPPSSTFLPWWDRDRSRIMLTTAVFVSTPYSFTLSRVVERLFPGKQGIQIAKKILTNSLMAPINISLVFTSVALLKGQSLHDAKAKVKRDLPKTYLAGACYWPIVSFFNFRFVPLDYRPFLIGLAGAMWNIYLSSVANRPHQKPQPAVE